MGMMPGAMPGLAAPMPGSFRGYPNPNPNMFPMFKQKQNADANAGAQAALNARFRGSRMHNQNNGFLSPSNRQK